MFGIDTLRINVAIAGIVITVGFYIQAFRIFRTKSAKDFSWFLILALLYNEISWLVYGKVIGEWPVFLLAIANIPADVAVLVGYILYRKGNRQ